MGGDYLFAKPGKVTAYTDGGCEPNPGPGGFGIWIEAGGAVSKPVELWGGHPSTTNNQMEMLAAIGLLERLPDRCEVLLYTDSQYVKRGITEWISGWKRKGWKKSGGGSVLNAELWRRLDKQAQRHKIRWEWVRGHDGNEGNERADELATDAIGAILNGSLHAADMAEKSSTPAASIAGTSGIAAPARKRRDLFGGDDDGASADEKPKKKKAASKSASSAAAKKSAPADGSGRRVVLATTSPYRAATFRQLGVPFEQTDSGVDEEAAKKKGLGPVELVRYLAREKALAKAAEFPDAILIGGDQAPMIDGELLDKPGTYKAATDQLLRLAGRTHHLITGVAVHDARTGETDENVTIHELTIRPLSREQAKRYVEADDTRACAGSYKYESRGIALFTRVHTDDATGIVGLPLVWLSGVLLNRGVELLP